MSSTLLKLGLHCSCFPVDFTKVFSSSFLQNTYIGLFLGKASINEFHFLFFSLCDHASHFSNLIKGLTSNFVTTIKRN